MTGGKRMEDLETKQICSRQEIHPQPQVVCRRESAASQLAPQGAGGAPLTAASQSWQLRCCAMCKEPVPGSTHAKLVSAAGTHTSGTWIFLPCKAWHSWLHGEGILAELGSQYALGRVFNPNQSHTVPCLPHGPVGPLWFLTPQKRPMCCMYQSKHRVRPSVGSWNMPRTFSKPRQRGCVEEA